ncbi:unnamed protein product [Alopecurus aequalis]
MGNSCSAKKPMQVTTSSLCTTEAATGTHNFVVMNYTLLDGMGHGKCVTSSTFSVGGHDWCIKFYPDGDGREPGYAGAFLCPCGDVGETGVRVYYTLSLRRQDGEVHGCSTPLTSKYTFTSGDKGIGITKLIKKSYLRLDCFTIRCDLTVVQDTIVKMMLPN